MAGVWTNNFQALKNIWLCGDALYSMSAMKDTSGAKRWSVSDTVNYHNNAFPITSPMAFVLANDIGAGSTADCIVKVGGGSAAPAATDYDLTEALSGISYLSVVNEKPVFNDSTGEVSNTIKLTLQNVGAEAVTIREWGLFARMWNWNGGTNQFRFMIYHATLDAPVIIAASQSAMLTLVRTVILTDPVSWPE